MDDLRKILSDIKIEKEPETFTIHFTPKDIAEMNCELMKRIGNFEEAEAFQYILDREMASNYKWACQMEKKYLSASEYVKRISTEGYR